MLFADGKYTGDRRTSVARGRGLHARHVGGARTAAEPAARSAQRLWTRRVGDRYGRGDGAAVRRGDFPRRAARIDARQIRRDGRMAGFIGRIRHRARASDRCGERLRHRSGARIRLHADRLALVYDHTPCRQ